MKSFRYRLIYAMIMLLMIGSCRITESEKEREINEVKEPITYLVLTFDDQHHNIYDVAFPLMKKYGIKGTNFVNTGYIGRQGRMTWEQLEEMEFEHGWETGGHTLHHIFLPEADDEEALYQIEQDWLNLKEKGLSHDSFALPRGAATARDYEILKRFYKNIRNSSNIKMYSPLDRYNIGYYAVRTDYRNGDIITRINQGILNQEDLVVIGFHRFNEDHHTHSITEEDFEAVLEYISNSPVEVVTIKEAAEKLK